MASLSGRVYQFTIDWHSVVVHLCALQAYIRDKPLLSPADDGLCVRDAGIVDHAVEPCWSPKLRRLLTAKADPSAREGLLCGLCLGLWSVWPACLSSCLFKFHLRELGTAPPVFILG